MLKLNLGAGDKFAYLPGYRNLDAKTGDSLFPLKYDDGEIGEIRCSHTLEHYSHHQTLDVLREWVRVLKPGGWLKIAVPDFDWITIAREKGSHQVELLQAYLMGGQTDDNDYHKAIFTHARLESLLEQVGLVNVQTWFSEIADCASLPVSLNLMGQKPEAVKCSHGQVIDTVSNPDGPFGKKCECCGLVFGVLVEGRKYCRPCEKASSDWREPMPKDVLEHPVDNLTAAGKRLQSSSRTQVFAAGRWQDLDGEVQCATQEELEAANRGELQMRTIVVGERRAARVALCLSTPRIGFLRPLERLLGVMHQAGVSVFSGDGVFWSHALSRSIKNACDFYFDDSGEGFDFILTADYDTYALPEDLKAIVELLARSPEADCIVPMQMKRGGTGEILAGGSNMNLTAPLVPIETGHFGFTLFRKEFFEKLPTPWFYEKPDVDGHWGEGRIDADIGMWMQAKKAKLNVMLAPGIVVGHGQEVVSWPVVSNGKVSVIHQAVNDWLAKGRPSEPVGVLSEPSFCNSSGA